MISGRVENRQALVPITYRLPVKPDLILEHVVDTGFTGELTLPLAAITAIARAAHDDGRTVNSISKQGFVVRSDNGYPQ